MADTVGIVHNVQRWKEFNDPVSSRQHAPVLSRPVLWPNGAHLERKGGKEKEIKTDTKWKEKWDLKELKEKTEEMREREASRETDVLVLGLQLYFILIISYSDGYFSIS